jgi:hypothetical protein
MVSQKVVISFLILDFFDFFVFIFMIDQDPNPEPECITVSVPQHWILFQYLLPQAVVPFRRPCTIIFLILFDLKTPYDSTLPSYASKDFIPSLFFVR